MDWNNKVVVITGAGTGIGKATKELLRERGATFITLTFRIAVISILSNVM